MVEEAKTKEMNIRVDLSGLVNGNLVRFNLWSRYRCGAAPVVALYEEVTRRRFFGKRTMHQFTTMVGNIGDRAVISYEVNKERNIVCCLDGAIIIQDEITNSHFYPQGTEEYIKKESQLRQAGLYHG